MTDALRAASLFRTYRHQFAIGAAINSWHTKDNDYTELITRHFNSITAENEMKPLGILDLKKTLAAGDRTRAVLDFTKTDELLRFAQQNGIQVRFHVLCWHNQTPFWFFTEGWEQVPFEKLKDPDTVIPFASPELMRKRQENYICDVMTHVNTCFPGVVYCWDVVNEAIEPDNEHPEGYRTRSPWFRIMGEEFIFSAFRAARKYRTPNQKLFYNDYNCYQPKKLQFILSLLRKLQAESLVDGMGMQGHLIMEYPSIADCEAAARAYADLNLTLQVTELDIHCPQGDDAGQQALAERYAAYFDMLVRLKQEGADINSVTFWGATDKDSWLPGFRKSESYPLLFTGEKQTKLAFDTVSAVPDRYAVIRLNQVGYASGLPVRIAVLSNETVRVKNANGIMIGEYASELKEDAASGDRVAVIDLGALPTGQYSITCGKAERKLYVEEQPWRDVTNALIKGLYYQRCGLELKHKHAGKYVHPACHTRAACFWENKDVHLSVPGGWHDAGDYGKYVTPGAVTVGHLIYTQLLFPDGCADLLNIPESGNGVPDILNEARWELEWILRMQRDDGAVYHKLTKDHFAPFIMPEDDTDQEYITPVSTLATADAAAVCALGARAWAATDPAFAERLLQAAELSWAWLDAHPDLIFLNQEAIHTGSYHDGSDRDERFWAACELYATTGKSVYRQAAETLYTDDMNVAQFGWTDVSGMGALCCLFDTEGKEPLSFLDRLKSNLLHRAEDALALSRASGYATALHPRAYGWGSILPLMNNTITMLLGWKLTERREFADAALDQLHYTLGMNALDISFITGFGEKQIMFPHHRPSFADRIDQPVPGLISGGPNGYCSYGSTRKILPDHTSPAKSFLDETPSADTNEIAIYWNSSTIFTFACFNQMTAK